MNSVLFGELDKCDLDCAFESFTRSYLCPTHLRKTHEVKYVAGAVLQFEGLMRDLCEATADEDFDDWSYSGPLAVAAIREGRKKRGG